MGRSKRSPIEESNLPRYWRHQGGAVADAGLFNYSIGPRQDRRWELNTESSSYLLIDDQLESRWPLRFGSSANSSVRVNATIRKVARYVESRACPLQVLRGQARRCYQHHSVGPPTPDRAQACDVPRGNGPGQDATPQQPGFKPRPGLSWRLLGLLQDVPSRGAPRKLLLN